MYKTTKEENEILTGTGRGTPMGEFLRRYWWPVGISAHLQSKPTFIRVFGEDLVLFRDGTGKAGVIGAYCAHRRANLCLGDIERDGVRCRYHGWLYDTGGKVVQIPGEPADSPLRKQDIRLPSYPVEELGGLIFAYFGQQPAPLVPRYNFLVGWPIGSWSCSSSRTSRTRRSGGSSKEPAEAVAHKQWVIPTVGAEFVCRMEDVLDLYAEPHDPARPVVCFDETSKQLIAETRTPLPMEPGSPSGWTTSTSATGPPTSSWSPSRSGPGATST